MKKKIFIALFLSLGLVIACSDSSDDTSGPQNIDKTPNLRAAGASANDILSNDNFDKLVIEIAYVPGFRPTPTSISNFEDYLRERTFKEDIEVIYNELPSPNEETLVLEEIRDLEDENRTQYNNGTTLAIYIYFADAPSDGDELDEGLVTLGAVYRNTSMVIYESTISELARRSAIVTVTDIETATLNHEFGHLFGLVNLGTPPINDHEGVQTDENDEPILDSNGIPLGNDHCNVDGCLMLAEIQFGSSTSRSLTSKGSVLTSPCALDGDSMLKILESRTAKGLAIVPVLDTECILDLQGNGGR
ncbi:hypothetical protein [Flagellimonas eckloniae]|uniref:Membrane metalloprotease n=1 Tax=Flagellimonas eckloniae TaxID=346185 RepID=A0A0Q1CJU4_9FLAO|nr:hypothetical protein [Allomuricauda eckloniae]KQC31288.1 hypothetical protein AAY42_16355 [Allomuricauda eckloniae]